ncbi:hypothetical protein HZH66_006382 [Vespula vulgaris]|uniref:Uncharacterized protein n=1 Tax=Vespula vulgaris TaxID=7454 RepID=A0A834K270_VESVU|nr:hypothetical protein HZH66_006382 [Vespula vulgaris]
MSGHIQKQLTRSLERILEEAHLSGELKLSGRKLKDFPKVGKPGAAKYNLQDTVIAEDRTADLFVSRAYPNLSGVSVVKGNGKVAVAIAVAVAILATTETKTATETRTAVSRAQPMTRQ